MGGKTGGRRLYVMGSKKLLDEKLEDEDESSDEDSSTISEVDSDTSSSKMRMQMCHSYSWIGILSILKQ